MRVRISSVMDWKSGRRSIDQGCTNKRNRGFGNPASVIGGKSRLPKRAAVRIPLSSDPGRRSGHLRSTLWNRRDGSVGFTAVNIIIVNMVWGPLAITSVPGAEQTVPPTWRGGMSKLTTCAPPALLLNSRPSLRDSSSR